MNPNVWRSDSRPFVYGHRGAPERRHENTIEGFTVAMGLGVDGVELDARRTADGRIAVHHDAHLDDGRVLCDVTEKQLPGCVPDLASALDACRGGIVNIEIKNSPIEPDFDPGQSVSRGVADLLVVRASNGIADRVLVSSFNPDAIRAVRTDALEIPTALVTLALDDTAAITQVVTAAAEAGQVAVHPWDPTVDAALVDRAHDAGLAVNVWTVDDPARMQELVAFGVDGICTNVPDVALDVLR